MDEASKIAAGMVMSAVVLVSGWIGYREYNRQRDRDEAAQLMHQVLEATTPKRTVVIPDPEQTRLEAQAAPAPWNGLSSGVDRDQLQADEQCFNGKVVQLTPRGLMHETRPDGSAMRCVERRKLR